MKLSAVGMEIHADYWRVWLFSCWSYLPPKGGRSLQVKRLFINAYFLRMPALLSIYLSIYLGVSYDIERTGMSIVWTTCVMTEPYLTSMRAECTQ